MAAIVGKTLQSALGARSSSISTKCFRSLTTVSSIVSAATADPFLVDASKAPDNFVADSAVVYPDVITSSMSDKLVHELAAIMKRRRYERGHWDAVILKYKETELAGQDQDHSLSGESYEIIESIRQDLLLPKHGHQCHKQQPGDLVKWLPCHAIDLHEKGELNAHVDSIRFSGGIVGGLSLKTGSIMRLIPAKIDESDELSREEEPECYVDLHLPANSLYVISGVSRYEYTHELRPSGALFRSTEEITRGHRISLIFRDAKSEADELS